MTQAVRAMQAGGPEVLEFGEVPTPKPGAGEVLVDVEAAGVNSTRTVVRVIRWIFAYRRRRGHRASPRWARALRASGRRPCGLAGRPGASRRSKDFLLRRRRSSAEAAGDAAGPDGAVPGDELHDQTDRPRSFMPAPAVGPLLTQIIKHLGAMSSRR